MARRCTKQGRAGRELSMNKDSTLKEIRAEAKGYRDTLKKKMKSNYKLAKDLGFSIFR